jgi:hypothetical protein
MAPKKKWMQKAVKNPGGLHRALGIPEGDKIPLAKKKAAAKKPGKLGQMGRLALVFNKAKKK